MSESLSLISRSALRFFSGTLVSRVTGLIRDMVMAFYFGTSSTLGAFFLTYRFVFLFRRLFGEGILHQGFTPHFEAIRQKNPKEGALFFRDLFWTIAFFLGVCLLLYEVGTIFFSGEVASLARYFSPGVFFICLFGLTSGLLQAEKRFFLPAVSSAGFNIVWILGVLILHKFPKEKALLALAGVISFAFLCQLVITLPETWRFLRRSLSLKECFSPRLFSSQLKKLVFPLLLGVIGVASVQVNSAIDVIFARIAAPEGPAYLWYAIRMQQLPLALFGVALASSLLPSYSRAIERGDEKNYFDLIHFGSKRAFALIFPCVVGIFVLGKASVNLLFGRGDFSPFSTVQTTYCLWAYGVGLLPAVMIQILSPAFYAKKDYKTPALIFCFSSLINIGLNSLLVFYFHLGAMSIALATSISAWLSAYLLSHFLRAGPRLWGASSMKVGLAALGAGTLVFGLQKIVFQEPLVRELTKQLQQFSFSTILFFGMFFALCKIFKAEDILKLFRHSSK